MASLIARVTSTSARAPLARLVTSPLGLDVWEVRPGFVVLQADEFQLDRLEAMGFAVEQLQTTETHLSAFATAAAVSGYHSVATLEEDLRRLAEEHPEIAELHEIGRSVEGRPLWALRIGERRGSARKVAFLGCHHAREWISVEVPFLLAEHLLENSSSDPVQGWLQQGEVWVAPMVNPDGHEYTRTQNRLWRKNRRRNPDGSIGVDPNRNYGYMWGTLDINTSSHVPSDETYVGPRAFSEPEVRAVRDLVARELFGGVLTYHSYSQLILYPWGYTDEPIEDEADHGEMRGLAEEMERLIREVHGRDLHRPAGVAALPDGGGHHRLDLRRVRRPVVHRSSCARHRRWTADSSCRPTRSSPAGRRIAPPHSSSSGTSSSGRKARGSDQGVGVAESDPTWVARLTPTADSSVAALLGLPFGLDVWERHAGFLVVAAPESCLAELERRRLATVERWATATEYQAQMRTGPRAGITTDKGTPCRRTTVDAAPALGAFVSTALED